MRSAADGKDVMIWDTRLTATLLKTAVPSSMRKKQAKYESSMKITNDYRL